MGARLNVLCLHHAGGNAYLYARWPQLAARDVNLVFYNLPGRAARMDEPFLEHMEDAVQDLHRQVGHLTREPFVVVGHCMGAWLGFEYLQFLQARHGISPLAFVPTAKEAPHRNQLVSMLQSLTPSAFDALVYAYSGVPLKGPASHTFRELFYPIVVADMSLLRNYRPQERYAPLRCPILGFAGRRDHLIESQRMQAWSELTSETFSLQVVDGDHLFVRDQGSTVLAVLKDVVAPASA